MNLDAAIVVEHPLPLDSDIAALEPLIRGVLCAESKVGDWSVNIALISDEALKMLHRDFMGLDTVTDVMTFPFGPEPWEQAQGGDIAISVERAEEQAPEFGHSTWQEIQFLVVHGVLHLCGWTDESAEQRTAMLARQRVLLDAFDRKGV